MSEGNPYPSGSPQWFQWEIDHPSSPPPPHPPGGGTSGSSSSSAPAPIEPTAQLESGYREILRRWGLFATKNLLNLIDKAIINRWPTTYFIDRVRHTPEYEQKFQGIQWKDGMSEAQYNSAYAQYRDRAREIGVDFTRQEFSKVLKRGTTLQEFSDRVDAIHAIEQWGPMFTTFAQVAEARGVPASKHDLVRMLTGSNKKLQKIYDETYLTVGLERIAGIQVGKDLPPGYEATPYGITRGDLLGLMKQAEAIHPGFDPSKLDFAKIGADLRQYKPEYLAQYGISTKDLLELEVGGPRSAQIAEKAQRVLATQQAFNQPRATPTRSNQLGQQAAQSAQELPQSR